MRCFVAIELSTSLRAELERLLRRAPGSRDIRWCRAGQLHVTLKFLGDVQPGRIVDVQRALERAACAVPAFELSLAPLGAFPSPQRPRILWCGLADAAAGCAALVQQLDPPLESLGFAVEPREYHPHITLARGRHPGADRSLREALRSMTPPAPVSMRVEEIVLFESRLGPGGSKYTAIFRAPLCQPSTSSAPSGRAPATGAPAGPASPAAPPRGSATPLDKPRRQH